MEKHYYDSMHIRTKLILNKEMSYFSVHEVVKHDFCLYGRLLLVFSLQQSMVSPMSYLIIASGEAEFTAGLLYYLLLLHLFSFVTRFIM